MLRVVFAGCGFLGESAAGLFLRSGWQVLGLCATGGTADRLSAGGFPVRVADITKPLHVPEGWHSPDLLIHCASSGRGGADEYRAVYRDGLGNAIGAFSPRRVGLFSGRQFAGQRGVGSRTNGGNRNGFARGRGAGVAGWRDRCPPFRDLRTRPRNPATEIFGWFCLARKRWRAMDEPDPPGRCG